MPKYTRYQDYVIRSGKLIGEFDQMYQDHDDPWEQTTRETHASEKAVALNMLARLKADGRNLRVLEMGCGLGDFTARIGATGVKAVGMDISPTAIGKARDRHPSIEFVTGSIADHDLIERLAPDVIVMAEITWYVLEQLPAFLKFYKDRLPDAYLIHLLMTYAPGVQQYGKEWFTNLDEIKTYFGLDYLETGLVHYDGGARTWFLGRPVRRAKNLPLVGLGFSALTTASSFYEVAEPFFLLN